MLPASDHPDESRLADIRTPLIYLTHDLPPDNLAAVRRVLGTVDRDGQELRRLTLTRSYPTTPEDLWEALTDPDRIPRWFLPISGDLRPGGRYQFEGNAGGDVLSCDAAPDVRRAPGSTTAG